MIIPIYFDATNMTYLAMKREIYRRGWKSVHFNAKEIMDTGKVIVRRVK